MCQEIVWDSPCGGVQYSKIEEVDCVMNIVIVSATERSPLVLIVKAKWEAFPGV